MTISIIAAIGRNRELGKENKLLWHIPEDFKRFKDLTSGHVVIMGRKTYESLPEKFRPLPNRINIVVTRKVKKYEIRNTKSETNLNDQNSNNKNLFFCSSLDSAIQVSSFEIRASNLNKEVFIIGGAQIYSLGIKYADKLYLTLIDKEYPEADAFFPDYSEFGKVVWEKNGVEGELKYRFVELVK